MKFANKRCSIPKKDTLKIEAENDITKKHLIFRNASKTDGLKFTCAAKIKKDQPFMLPL